jgi:hypothetical protein
MPATALKYLKKTACIKPLTRRYATQSATQVQQLITYHYFLEICRDHQT